MELKTIIGIIAGICTSGASIPQIFKVIKDKKSQDISPWMFIVLLTGNSLWTYYGIMLNDWPIISTNALAVILDITMIVLNYKYSK